MLLPSGYRIRGVIPGLSTLARRGLLDTRVQQAVLRLAAKEYVKPAETEPDENDWQTTIDAYVAGFPREALDPGDDPTTGTWKVVQLGLDDLDGLDQRDRHALQMLVMRLRSAESITASVERGDYDLEGAGDLERLAEFRDVGDGAAGGEDGAGVADAPVGAAVGG